MESQVRIANHLDLVILLVYIKLLSFLLPDRRRVDRSELLLVYVG